MTDFECNVGHAKMKPFKISTKVNFEFKGNEQQRTFGQVSLIYDLINHGKFYES